MKPDAVINDLKNPSLDKSIQRKQADLLAQLNKLQLEGLKDQSLESSIQAMEMAFRMQFPVPDVFDIDKEVKQQKSSMEW